MVIHGGLDGYSRVPVYLKISDNNRADTVLSSFQEAAAEFGMPRRVRSDKGNSRSSREKHSMFYCILILFL